MPLTPHGERMMARLREEYPDKKTAERVFYASANAGKPGFSDVHGAIKRRLKRGR